MLSFGNKLYNFENSSKTYDIVGRNLLETLCVMLIVINFKGAGADLGKEGRGEGEGGGGGGWRVDWVGSHLLFGGAENTIID